MPSLNETSVLLTNDDGVEAEGLASLRMALTGLVDVVVVAPREHMSATSHSISLYKPVRYEKLGEARYAVHGTPVDSVILALNEILKRPPALVISGINQGGNLGQNVFYSGTVAAAVEGTFHG
ncbi:MAG: 5'/3'-nucleotidase SurE, partial [Terriglobia bacterium]